MRFKLPLNEGSGSIMLLNIFIFLASSFVFASPVLLKPELEIQNSNSEVETSFYIISDASASIENVERCIIPADADPDVDFESDSVLGSRNFDPAEASLGLHAISPGDGTRPDDNKESLVADIMDNISTPDNVKRDAARSITPAEDHVAKLFADVLDSNISPDKVKRHNWAFVCYITTVRGQELDRAFTETCRKTYGYTCVGDGRKYAQKPNEGCDGGCECVDLFPKSKFGAGIKLNVNGALRYVSKARDLDSALEDDLLKRHNYAFVCYDVRAQGSVTDRAFTDHCIQKYGYSCLGNGRKSARTINEECEIECKCENLYPKNNFDAIKLDIHGASRYVSKARDPDFALESSDLSHDKFDVVRELVKRHNYALACYETNPDRDPNTLLDKDFTSICINSRGYSCSSSGKITKKTTFEFCEDDCRCIDLYPKQGARAIVLNINGVSRYVSKARDLDATDALPNKNVKNTLRADGLVLPEKRHNNALVCYDKDPFANPKTALVDTTKSRDCLSRGFTCSSGNDGGEMFRTKDSKSLPGDCYTVCRCENLFPISKVLTACAIVLTVQGINRCVSRRDMEILPGSDIPTITLTKNETNRLNARHNFALSCYTGYPTNPLATIDTVLSRTCLDAGFNCNSEGKMAGKNGIHMTCWLFCKCQDLYPKSDLLKSCAIALTVVGVKKCVSRRDIEVLLGSDIPMTTLTKNETNHLNPRHNFARHNFALSCYDRPPNNQFANVDTVLSRKCLDARVNCNSEGKLTTPRDSPMNCYLYCNCQDLYPKSNLLKSCAIALTVAGVKKCISHRDLDLAADSQSPKITARDSTESLVARHNYALSCYNENPWFNPLTARVDTAKSRACLAEGLNCDGEGTLHENENPPSKLNCHEDCRCDNLYPKSNFLKACAIALTVAQYQRCVSQRDDLSIGAESLDVSISARDSPEVEFVTVTDLAHSHETNVDAPFFKGDDDLQKRHNWALVCTKIDKTTLQKSTDTTLSRTCLSIGYSCNSDGKKPTKKFDELCDDVCKCEDLYPKNNLWACTIKIVAQGVSRCVSWRDIDTYIGLGDTFIDGIDERSEYSDTISPPLEVAEAKQGEGSTALSHDSLKDAAAIEQPKIQRHNDTVQLNTTAQHTSAADDIDSSSFHIDCQDPLMTLRCLFEISGYTCEVNGAIYSIWNDYAWQVFDKELWIQPDWRTCNCVCTCVLNRRKRDNYLELPTPEDIRKRIHGYTMQCGDTSSTETCTTSRYFCDHQGGLRFHPSGSQSSICEASCRCVDLKPSNPSSAINNAPTSFEGMDASDSKVGLTRRKFPKIPKPKPKPKKAWVMSCKDNDLVFTKHCAVEKNVGCNDAGKLYAEAGGNMDPDCQAKCICQYETVGNELDESVNNVAAIEDEPDQQPTEKRERRGEYIMECAANLTLECAGTDLVRCSRMGILHTEDSIPVDDACALHCRCLWKTDGVVPSYTQALPALFYHDASFRSTRHRHVIPRISPRQQSYFIGDKTHQCDSLLYGKKQWALLCQEQPGDDYYTLTTRCADEGQFWCSWGDKPDPTYRASAPGYIKNRCLKTCVCYSRYEPNWDIHKRNVSPVSAIPMGLSPVGTLSEKREATTMITATAAAK